MTPRWYYEPSLCLDDGDWQRIKLFAGPNADQAGLLFMRVDDNDGGVAIVGMHPEQVQEMRDYFDHWLAWCEDCGFWEETNPDPADRNDDLIQLSFV